MSFCSNQDRMCTSTKDKEGEKILHSKKKDKDFIKNEHLTDQTIDFNSLDTKFLKPSISSDD